MRRRHALELLAEIALDQRGYVTRAQAAAAGVDDVTLSRAAAMGDLERVDHGIYRHRGAPAHEHEDLWVAWLRLRPEQPAWERLRQPQEAVSHRSAARLYELGSLPADDHEFTSNDRRQTRRPDVRVHRGPIEPDDWEPLHDMPVTRPPRIVADLLDAGVDGGHVGLIVEGALDQGLAMESDMLEVLASRSRRFSRRAGDGEAVLAHLLELAASELAV